MKQFHLLSFVIGILSGFFALWMIVGSYRWIVSSTSSVASASVTTGGSRRQGNGAAPNLARFAQQLNMTEAALQKELATGKTIKQIATEKGVTLHFGNRGTGSGMIRTGSGRTASGAFRQRMGMTQPINTTPAQ